MSRWSEVIYYTGGQPLKDEDGFPIPGSDEAVSGPVFANRKSVRSSEFYQAAQNGLRLETVLEVRLADYQDQQHLLWNNRKYAIERTYKKTDIVELVCSLFDGEAV